MCFLGIQNGGAVWCVLKGATCGIIVPYRDTGAMLMQQVKTLKKANKMRVFVECEGVRRLERAKGFEPSTSTLARLRPFLQTNGLQVWCCLGGAKKHDFHSNLKTDVCFWPVGLDSKSSPCFELYHVIDPAIIPRMESVSVIVASVPELRR